MQFASRLSRLVLAALCTPVVAFAQDAVLRVRVIRPDSQPIAGVQVRLDSLRARTDARGEARLVTLPVFARFRRSYRLRARLGRFVLRAGADTALTFVLVEQLAGVTVSATRSERRIEDDPVRVEVLDAEEVVEKLLMTPGDITMMLNETSGLRVQVTSPSLGGASVRVQGLRGRYTQILSDGLPLYGGQTGGLGAPPDPADGPRRRRDHQGRRVGVVRRHAR